MKKTLFICTIVSLALLTSCQSANDGAFALVGRQKNEQKHMIDLPFDITTISDHPIIEDAMRVSLNKPEGELTRRDFLTVTDLDIDLGYLERVGSELYEEGMTIDLLPLLAMGNLERLALRALGEDKFSSIDVLTHIDSLKELRTSRLSVNFFDVIKEHQGLELVRFTSHEIDTFDFGELVNLPNLKEIRIGARESNEPNMFVNLEALANLPALENLTLNSGNITNIEALSNTESLKALDLAQNSITDVSPIKRNADLVFINFQGNPINDISALTDLTKLTDARLSDTQIDNIDVMANWVSLERLSISGTDVSDISALGNIDSLIQFFSVNTSVRDYSPVDHVGFVEPYERK